MRPAHALPGGAKRNTCVLDASVEAGTRRTWLGRPSFARALTLRASAKTDAGRRGRRRAAVIATASGTQIALELELHNELGRRRKRVAERRAGLHRLCEANAERERAARTRSDDLALLVQAQIELDANLPSGKMLGPRSALLRPPSSRGVERGEQDFFPPWRGRRDSPAAQLHIVQLLSPPDGARGRRRRRRRRCHTLTAERRRDGEQQRRELQLKRAVVHVAGPP